MSAYVPQKGDPSDPVRARAAKRHSADPYMAHAASAGPASQPHGHCSNNVVLLVRGELFKRYPNAIVYAGKAKRVGRTRVLDETDERYPIFRGTLPPDITFLGFNLSLDDARGGTPQSPKVSFLSFSSSRQSRVSAWSQPRILPRHPSHTGPTLHGLIRSCWRRARRAAGAAAEFSSFPTSANDPRTDDQKQPVAACFAGLLSRA